MTGKKILTGFLLACLFLPCNVAYAVAKPASGTAAEGSPQVMVESYEVTEGQLLSGQKVNLKMNIKNESVNRAAKSLVLTYHEKQYQMLPQDGAGNQVFIGEIGPGEVAEVNIPMVIAEELRTSLITLELSISYGDEDGVAYLNQPTIYFNVFPEHLVVENLYVSSQPEEQRDSLVSVSYRNQSTETISNLVFHVNGDIAEEGKQMSFLSLAPGEQRFSDIQVAFNKTGEQRVTAYFTYQDESGHEFATKEQTVTVQVVPGSDLPSYEEKTIDMTVIGVKAAITLVLLLAGIMVIKKGLKEKKRAFYR